MQSHFTTQPRKDATPIYSGSHVVGEVRGKVFYKTVCGSKHFLRQPKAICSDDSVLADAERAGAVEIRIRDTETGEVYSAPLEAFKKFGFPVRRGFGAQTGLTLERFNITQGGRTIRQARIETQPAAQLSLGF
jgi:hypothetical protein